jgi:hypothetical protein
MSVERIIRCGILASAPLEAQTLNWRSITRRKADQHRIELSAKLPGDLIVIERFADEVFGTARERAEMPSVRAEVSAPPGRC